ncbi:ABC transporter permease [Rhodopirellula sp. P2]|uniref:ABC transporter permease n=1 Tax=Rhodopirellula sp. P2 TaxID=2127060 RepID=UPI002367A9FB|nr:ABC transporter permease [Rhodopirellula sp. P2]WDQ15826.1 ABC transporter permease [Rhodopirellula sp. P2]
MNDTRVWQGLLWKEAKQIVPLIGMLLGVTAFLFIVWAAMSQNLNVTLSAAGNIVPLIMPALFAAGAGAILISHEKETRTLNWLASLPIPVRPIVAAKLLVAIVGLLLMWVGCVVLAFLAGLEQSPTQSGTFELSQVHPAFWFVHSFYVLLCGFYTSWRNKNAFPALVWIIPLALLPFFVAEIWTSLFQSSTGQFTDVNQKTWVLGIITSLFLPAIGWLAYRAGTTALQADEPDDLRPRDSLTSVDAWRPPEMATPSRQPFRDSYATMVWQTVHASPWMSLGLLVPLAAGAIAWLVATNMHDSLQSWIGTSIQTTIGLALLAVSWLGVGVFTGDGAAVRLKFLADRGVSPSRVWLGRHWFGLSSLAATALLILAVQVLIGSPDPIEHQRAPIPEMSLLTIASVLLVIYGVSQWVSQVVPMLAASAFLAPVLSLVALAALADAGIGNGVRFGWLLSIAFLPFIATWWTMRTFMDGNRGLGYWAFNVVAGLAFMFLPTVPVSIARSQLPQMSAERVAELLPEAQKLDRQHSFNAISMRYGDLELQDDLSVYAGVEIDGETAVDRMRRRELLSPDAWIVIGDMDDAPLRGDQGIIKSALDAASLVKIRWQQNPDDQAEKERLGAFFSRLTTVVRRLRMSTRWIDQEIADQTEIWLVANLMDPTLQPLQSEPFYQEAVALVGDFEARQEARRMALLVCWIRDRKSPSLLRRTNDGVGPSDHWLEKIPAGWRHSVLHRKFGAVVDRCLSLIEKSNSKAAMEADFRALDLLVGQPGGEFETGPYGDLYRDGQDSNALTKNFSYLGYPATNWFETWEYDAQQLAMTPQVPKEDSATPQIPSVEEIQ